MQRVTQLHIIEHQSLVEQRFSKNGIQKLVKVVMKNKPFTLTIGINSPYGLNFNSVPVEAVLMFDSEKEHFVDVIKDNPIEYKSTINEDGSKMVIEVRLLKLSSHLDNMFFKIRVKPTDGFHFQGMRMDGMMVTSAPIRVVSKLEQIARIKQKQSGIIPEKKAKTTRKRARDDEELKESLDELKKKQEEHNRLLRQLLVQQGVDSSSSSSSSSPSSSSSSPSSSVPLEMTVSTVKEDSPAKKGKADVSESFEHALNHLLILYKQMDSNQVPSRFRRIIGNLSNSDSSSLSEMVHIISSQIQHSSGMPGLPRANLPDVSHQNQPWMMNSNPGGLETPNLFSDAEIPSSSSNPFQSFGEEMKDDFYADFLMPNQF